MENGQQKKGLPALAWVGIGCGVLIIIFLIVLFAGGLFVANKVKDVADDYNKNPELATARMIVKLNPEIEEVGVDEEAGTITIRDVESGKTVTANFKDFKDGKFTLTGDDGETVTFDADTSEDGGSMSVSSGDESWTVATGDKSAPVPDWVPVPDEGAAGSHHTMTDGSGYGGSVIFMSDQSVDDLIAFFQKELKADGFNATVNRFSGDQGNGGIVTGMKDAEHRSVIVTIGDEDGQRSVGVAYAQEKPSTE